MNSIMEQWVRACRRELLDRTLIWNRRRLLHALREFRRLLQRASHRQGIANARLLRPLPLAGLEEEGDVCSVPACLAQLRVLLEKWAR